MSKKEAALSLEEFLTELKNQKVTCRVLGTPPDVFQGTLVSFDSEAIYLKTQDRGTVAVMRHAIASIYRSEGEGPGVAMF
jgi:sRNA-binding regulator protein Hfq